MAFHITQTPVFDQSPVPSATIDLIGTLRRLKRRRGLIVGVVAAGLLAAAPLIMLVKAEYTARASIIFDPLQRHMFDSKAGLKDLPTSDEMVAGQVEVVRSRKVIGRVVQKLDLTANPELNTALAEPSLLESWLDIRGHVRTVMGEAQALLAAYFPGAVDAVEPAPAVSVEDAVIDEVQNRLGVRQLAPAPVVRLSFKARDPELAARVTNAIADEYLAFLRDTKATMMEHTVKWLDDRITVLRAEVDKRDRAVVEFRSAAGLMQGPGMVQGSSLGSGQNWPLASQEITEVMLRMAQARAENRTTMSRLEQVEAQLRRPGGAESASEVIDSPLVQNLRRDLSAARKQLADASASGAELHPKVITARAQVNELQAALRAEVDRIVANLRSRLTLAAEQEKALAGILNGQYDRAGALNEKEVQLRALQRDADVSLTTLQAFLARSKEISEFVSDSPIDAEVISYASTPEEADPPGRSTLLIVALFGTTLAGISLALVMDFVDSTIRTRDEAEIVTGRPMLELLPTVGYQRRRPVTDRVIDEPHSAFTESLRSLSTTLLQGGPGAHGTTILVTSSLPQEGKTTLTLSLGRLLARGKRKVVVVDCDLRRAGLHAALGGARSPGVSDYVAGQADLDSLLRADSRTPLSYVPAGSRVEDPMEVLGSQRMKTLLDLLATRFDVVLIDVPPVLAVNDARMFAGLVDTTLLLVSWASTRRETVVSAVRRLADVNMSVDGVVLSRVDLKRYANYERGSDYGCYAEKRTA
ncbi:MAG TPA: Wzz/FepE/Etk N-terminal domain-containing protein [Azospirillum sp.]|nr:Wzz/FepE/Etk N-terminal domain-containing protein [Azospirillum sp.]